MADLNELAADSPISLQLAFSISARGEIVGMGQKNDEIHGFLATPDNTASTQEEMLRSARRPSPVVISGNTRKLLLRRLGNRNLQKYVEPKVRNGHSDVHSCLPVRHRVRQSMVHGATPAK